MLINTFNDFFSQNKIISISSLKPPHYCRYLGSFGFWRRVKRRFNKENLSQFFSLFESTTSIGMTLEWSKYIFTPSKINTPSKIQSVAWNTHFFCLKIRKANNVYLEFFSPNHFNALMLITSYSQKQVCQTWLDDSLVRDVRWKYKV